MPHDPSVYGGLYQAGAQHISITQPDTFVQLSLKSELPSLDIEANGENGLVIQNNGDYEANYHVLISASDAVTVAVGVRKNGFLIPSTKSSQLLTTSNASFSFGGHLAASTIVALQAGDVLDLAVTVVGMLPPNLDISVNGYANATLTLKKL